jgi:CRP-like cAMP-binding protein
MFKIGRKPAPGDAKQELGRVEALYASRPKQAIAELAALVEAHPKSAAPRVRLADWLADDGRTDDAIAQLYKLQELLAAKGNLLAAISAGLRIVELDPRFENPLSYVAKVSTDQLRERQNASAGPEAPEGADPFARERLSLARIPFLSELTPEELGSVARGMKRRLLHAGATVFEQGDATRSLCFVVSGRLEIRAGERRLDTAEPGQCLGEFAFLTGEPRSATLAALADSEVLELSHEAMRGVIESHPRVAAVLDRMYHGRVLARVLAESELFGFLPAGERHRIASKFELTKIPRGIAVVAEGATEGALFLVKRGLVEIRSERVSEPLGRVGPNEFFGEVSFLTGVPRTADVVTLEDSEILRIDQDSLRELASEHPKLVEVLKQHHLDRVMNAVRRAKTARA